ASILSDGTFAQWFTNKLDIPLPDLTWGGSALVGLKEGHAWLTGKTVYIINNGYPANSRTWDHEWQGMLFNNSWLLLYSWDDFIKRVEICIVKQSSLVTINKLPTSTPTLHKDDYYDSWDFIASAPRALL